MQLRSHFNPNPPAGRPLAVRLPRPGFSLLELLVVVALITVLASLVAPNVLQQLRENHVAQASESVRDVLAECRSFALDAGLDYQFRYEVGGRYFVALPMELEPSDANATAGESTDASYTRLAGQLDDGFRLQASADSTEATESLEAAWFGQLDNGLILSQATWSAPIIFRFDGSADGGGFRVTTDEKLTADLRVRGLTGGISVSRVYRESD